MDENSESKFIHNLNKSFPNLTVILITHKKEHAKFFDKVVDLDNLNL